MCHNRYRENELLKHRKQQLSLSIRTEFREGFFHLVKQQKKSHWSFIFQNENGLQDRLRFGRVGEWNGCEEGSVSFSEEITCLKVEKLYQDIVLECSFWLSDQYDRSTGCVEGVASCYARRVSRGMNKHIYDIRRSLNFTLQLVGNVEWPRIYIKHKHQENSSKASQDFYNER